MAGGRTQEGGRWGLPGASRRHQPAIRALFGWRAAKLAAHPTVSAHHRARKKGSHFGYLFLPVVFSLVPLVPGYARPCGRGPCDIEPPSGAGPPRDLAFFILFFSPLGLPPPFRKHPAEESHHTDKTVHCGYRITHYDAAPMWAAQTPLFLSGPPPELRHSRLSISPHATRRSSAHPERVGERVTQAQVFSGRSRLPRPGPARRASHQEVTMTLTPCKPHVASNRHRPWGQLAWNSIWPVPLSRLVAPPGDVRLKVPVCSSGLAARV